MYSGGTEMVNVQSENINITSTSTGMATGTVKGTFDGYMVDANYNNVRVTGSFNISQ